MPLRYRCLAQSPQIATTTHGFSSVQFVDMQWTRVMGTQFRTRHVATCQMISMFVACIRWALSWNQPWTNAPSAVYPVLLGFHLESQSSMPLGPVKPR